MHTRVRFIIGGLVALIALRFGASALQDSSADRRLQAWIVAVNEHVPGERDLAVTTVALWSRKDLDDVLARLKRVLDSGHTLNNAFLKKAARLHADVAIAYKTEHGYALPPGDQPTLAIFDGQPVFASTGTVHWSAGRQLLEWIRPASSLGQDDDVRLWYRATTAFLQEHNEFYELEPHLARALTLFPKDAFLLLAAGSLHEGYAEDRVQHAFFQSDGTVRITLPGRTLAGAVATSALSPASTRPSSIRSASTERQEAERLFREALAADPSLAEARIRLGHVLAARQRDKEAVLELQAALHAPLPALLEYYALLFLGRSKQSLDQREEAVAAFEEAAKIYPSAQSPHLALSQLAGDSGNHSKALKELEVLTQPSTMTRDDPWWRYNRIHVPDAAAQLTRLRTASLQ
jgi:tetratricopeptide (TPR) repeat protein